MGQPPPPSYRNMWDKTGLSTWFESVILNSVLENRDPLLDSEYPLSEQIRFYYYTAQ